jgi:hypothetical protein
MVGEYTAICWRTKIVAVHKMVDGIWMTGESMERIGDPFITFVDIRHDKQTDEDYEDEDSPLMGGISAEFAQQIIKELTDAVEYMNQLQATA